MIQDSELLLNLWLSVKPYIPKKELIEAAGAYIRNAEEFIDIEAVMPDVLGQCRALDAAMEEMWPSDIVEEFDDDDGDFDVSDSAGDNTDYD